MWHFSEKAKTPHIIKEEEMLNKIEEARPHVLSDFLLFRNTRGIQENTYTCLEE